MMKAGTYWVGDPCYVLGDESGWQWDDVLDQTDYFMSNQETGEYTLIKGTGERFIVACFGTEYGDGEYAGSNGHSYGVDAGMLACIPMDAIDADDPSLEFGTIEKFDKDFSCEFVSEGGVIVFGHIRIVTGHLDDFDDSDV